MRLKKWMISMAIPFVLLFCVGVKLYPQAASTSETPRQRGFLQVVAKDKQTGDEGIVDLYRKVYGVIIGIDLYENLSPGLQLNYAVKDAKGLEKLLRERFAFDEIYTLYNSEAKKENIMSLLLGKLSQNKKDDAVLIFFAGHGYTETTQYGELGYLIPSDGSLNKNELYKNISMTQLKEDVSKRIPAKHVFFMIDACYSGLLVTRGKQEETSRDLAYLKEITGEPVRQVLTAGGSGEKVLDGGPYGHSVFVGRIVQILQDITDYITASELSSKVKEKVFSDSRAMGHTQTPAFGAFFGLGDFVFVPKVDKRYEELQTEIEKLRTQLKEIEQQNQSLNKIKSDKERREAAGKAEELKQKLKARQLEQERIKKELDRKERLKQEEEKFIREQKQKRLEIEKRKIEQEAELKRLREKVAAEQAKVKEVKHQVLSLDEARKEVAALEAKIKEIENMVNIERKKAESQLELDYQPLREMVNKPIPPKGQFETTSEYNARGKKHNAKITALENRYETDYMEIQNKYENEISIRTKIYKNQVTELKTRKYTVEGLKVELLNYNPDNESYRLKLTDAINNSWYYYLLIDRVKARGLYGRKELLKAEGYYQNLEDTTILIQVAIIDPILGKLSPIKNVFKNSKGYLEKDYGDGIVIVYIPSGEFKMGADDDYTDEKPLHIVYLDGYWIGKYEVTFDQYDKYCEETKKKKQDDEGWGRGNRPVINVSWDDSLAYCDWLSKKTGLKFNLPTESQWEKAARGNDQRKFPWGSRESDERLTNFSINISNTTPVGSYPAGASPYGLLDIAGNVREWCSDWYGTDYYKNSPLKNPMGPNSGSRRVVRGGGWNGRAWNLRCAYRDFYGPSSHSFSLGFRLRMDDK